MIILIDCGIILKEVPLIPNPEAVSIVARQSISREQCNPCTYHYINLSVPQFPITLLIGPLYYFPRSLPPSKLANPVVLHYGGNEMYRDCIAPAIYSE